MVKLYSACECNISRLSKWYQRWRSITLRLGCLSTLESVALSLVILLKTFILFLIIFNHISCEQFTQIMFKMSLEMHWIIEYGFWKAITWFRQTCIFRLRYEYILSSLIWRWCCCFRGTLGNLHWGLWIILNKWKCLNLKTSRLVAFIVRNDRWSEKSNISSYMVD